MADEDDLFAGRPDGPRVVPAADLGGAEEPATAAEPLERAVEEAAPADAPPAQGGAPARDALRPVRIAVLAASALAMLIAAPRAGIDDTYAMVYVGFIAVWLITWVPATVLGAVLALVGVGRRGVREAAISWVAVVPMAILWGLVLLGALVD